jgi:hypothetical protein
MASGTPACGSFMAPPGSGLGAKRGTHVGDLYANMSSATDNMELPDAAASLLSDSVCAKLPCGDGSRAPVPASFTGELPLGTLNGLDVGSPWTKLGAEVSANSAAGLGNLRGNFAADLSKGDGELSSRRLDTSDFSGVIDAKLPLGALNVKPPVGGLTAKQPFGGGPDAKPPSGGMLAKLTPGGTDSKLPSVGIGAEVPSSGRDATPPAGGVQAKPAVGDVSGALPATSGRGDLPPGYGTASVVATGFTGAPGGATAQGAAKPGGVLDADVPKPSLGVPAGSGRADLPSRDVKIHAEGLGVPAGNAQVSSSSIIIIIFTYFLSLGAHTGHKTMRFTRSSELAVLGTRSRILPIWCSPGQN